MLIDQNKHIAIFNYTDHLGNIWLSYTAKGSNVKILEENHYYPFGLKHNTYTPIRKDVKLKATNLEKEIKQMQPEALKYKYKYQEQELQTELGLNWYAFKYRNYNPEIGRFMSLDPLAEKFAYNGVYNFSENRVIDGRELERLEVILIHADIRASLFITASGTAGIYLDLKNNDVGLFITPGLGAGFAGGASAGFGATFFPTAGIDDVKGWGYSQVYSVTLFGKLGFSVDHNFDTNLNKTTEHGLTLSSGAGIEVVGAVEGTYTYVLEGKTIAKTFYNILDGSDQKQIIDIMESNKNEMESKMLDLTQQYGKLEIEKTNITDRKKLKEIRIKQKEIRNEIQSVSKSLKKVNDWIDYFQE